MPYHVLLDQLEERERGPASWGPPPAGSVRRTWTRSRGAGIRVVDLMEPDDFRARLRRPALRGSAASSTATSRRAIPSDDADCHREATDAGPIADAYLAAGGASAAARRRRPGGGRRGAATPGERILLEGQLGHDARHRLGHLPYVTSSCPIPGGASLGAGLPAVRIDRCSASRRRTPPRSAPGRCRPRWTDAEGEELRERGVEYGTSTGRARRCGWYDAVAVSFSVRLAGYSSIALTKLDVLDAFRAIQLARAYRDPTDGREWTTVPASTSVYQRLEPVYEELPGWQTDTTGCRSWGELPAAGP